jgi:hypothetical protein
MPTGHQLPVRCRVVATPILHGLTTNIAWSARRHDAETSPRIIFAEHTRKTFGAVIFI